MNFKERLIEKIKQKESIVCAGIDPDVNAKQFPEEIREYSKIPKQNFAERVLDEIADLVPVIKVNTRFFMPDEMNQLVNIVRYAHDKDLEVIGDCKQNDIGNTMEMAYEKEFGFFDWDAITVNGYFGSDGIAGDGIFGKWFENGKGLFVLVKTSNRSGGEIQDIRVRGEFLVNVSSSGFEKHDTRLYHLVANLVQSWSSDYGNVIGAVVGATQPEQLKDISKIIEGIILLPGYGTQGGTADVLEKLPDGRYCIVNSSRGIMYAYDRRFKGKYTQDEFAKAARAEVEFMNEDLNEHFKGFN